LGHGYDKLATIRDSLRPLNNLTILTVFLQLSKTNEVREAVKSALELGYRHVDAAAVYGNEAEVGEGIKASGVPREEIFVRSTGI